MHRNIKITGGSEEPWFTRKAINKLSKIICSNDIGFEYGMGSSTIWYALRVKKLYTIEHDKSWYQDINKQLKEKKITNVNSYLIKADTKLEQNYKSYHDLYKNKSFKSYINKIKEYPDNYFNFISIDGRARNAGIREAIIKLKPKGLLILDNSDRIVYDEGKQYLKKWKLKRYKNGNIKKKGFWETSIYIKPL